MPGNTRHNLIESTFSNTESPIGGIEKALVHFNMGTFKYLPHYNISHRKWVLGLYTLLKLIINCYQFLGTR